MKHRFFHKAFPKDVIDIFSCWQTRIHIAFRRQPAPKSFQQNLQRKQEHQPGWRSASLMPITVKTQAPKNKSL